jgi:hypothetical protein
MPFSNLMSIQLRMCSCIAAPADMENWVLENITLSSVQAVSIG